MQTCKVSLEEAAAMRGNWGIPLRKELFGIANNLDDAFCGNQAGKHCAD
jgi:hypothetical protein